MMKQLKPPSLLRWILLRVLSLAIGCVIIISTCMWLGYQLMNIWVLNAMPEHSREEMLRLFADPQIDILRYHQLMDAWYGVNFSNPTVITIDWILLCTLVLVAIPIIMLLGLYVARPVSRQFTHLAKIAREVSEGAFYHRVKFEKRAPAELIELTKDFNAMIERLSQYERELKASHVAMAHELRSPLTAAIGRLQGVIDGVFPRDAQQFSLVMNQLTHLNRLIDDLYLLSVVKAGQLQLDMSLVNIIELLRERILWLRPQAELQGFTFALLPYASSTLMLDPYRIGQVFIILMDNALRYAQEGKRLEISLCNEAGILAIYFRDYGNAVSDEFLSQMFELFTRADSSRTRYSGGSGLGLSIARAICELHGGSLEAEICPDGGMIFTVRLPSGICSLT
ncbi:TPA: two-component sensor histidine kinase [Serratia marcescens]|nr:two-component sensor histidine kinase [Serratia marcescens]